MMTWAAFKAEVEKQGVKDDTPIAWIDVSSTDAKYISARPNSVAERADVLCEWRISD